MSNYKPLGLENGYTSPRMLVDTELLANILHLTPRRINQMAEDSIILPAEDQDLNTLKNAWNLPEVVRDYIGYKMDQRGWRQMR